MSRRDKRQLVVIYSSVAIVAVLSAFVFSGAFGQPKFVKTSQSAPNWFTSDNQPVELVGSTDQSSEFTGNFRGDYNLATESYYGVDGVRQDSGSTTGIPSY